MDARSASPKGEAARGGVPIAIRSNSPSACARGRLRSSEGAYRRTGTSRAIHQYNEQTFGVRGAFIFNSPQSRLPTHLAPRNAFWAARSAKTFSRSPAPRPLAALRAQAEMALTVNPAIPRTVATAAGGCWATCDDARIPAPHQ